MFHPQTPGHRAHRNHAGRQVYMAPCPIAHRRQLIRHVATSPTTPSSMYTLSTIADGLLDWVLRHPRPLYDIASPPPCRTGFAARATFPPPTTSASPSHRKRLFRSSSAAEAIPLRKPRTGSFPVSVILTRRVRISVVVVRSSSGLQPAVTRLKSIRVLTLGLRFACHTDVFGSAKARQQSGCREQQRIAHRSSFPPPQAETVDLHHENFAGT